MERIGEEVTEPFITSEKFYVKVLVRPKYAKKINKAGYSVYEGLKNKGIVHACCMAHARRKFREALQNDKVKAEWMLDKIQFFT